VKRGMAMKYTVTVVKKQAIFLSELQTAANCSGKQQKNILQYVRHKIILALVKLKVNSSLCNE
jgi:hypothetical protein